MCSSSFFIELTYPSRSWIIEVLCSYNGRVTETLQCSSFQIFSSHRRNDGVKMVLWTNSCFLVEFLISEMFDMVQFTCKYSILTLKLFTNSLWWKFTTILWYCFIESVFIVMTSSYTVSITLDYFALRKTTKLWITSLHMPKAFLPLNHALK